MIAAIYSNANYGSEDIQKAVGGLEEHYKKALESVYAPPRKKPQIDWKNPFWAGAKASYDKQREAIRALRNKEGRSVEDVVNMEDKRRERLKGIDQAPS